ncbi:MAG TPA: type 4a pilus biogenesis protein PilO [Elusimicrobiales bacterium]|nr:type 4a pilus biogenesis protein PilO [Elusimicrobiales bacterium]
MAGKLTAKTKFSKEQIKTLFAVILFGGAFSYLYVMYMWKPYAVRINTAQTEIEVISKDLIKAKVAAKRYDKILAELEQLKKKSEFAEKSLSTDRRLPDLIFSIMEASRKYDVRINYITPRPSVVKEFYIEDNYKMSIAGDYHIVGLFISFMTTSERVFTIRNLSMSETKKDGEAEARFDLIAYQYRIVGDSTDE